MAARSIVILGALLLATSNVNAARSLLQAPAPAPGLSSDTTTLIANGLAYVQSDPQGAANALSSMVADSGSSSALTDMLQQAVNAIGSYRSVLQNQLPAPVSSLTDLKSVTGLDTALAGKAATYVLDKLGSSNYDQVVAGLKSLLNSGGTTAISGDVSYTTALAFVQALGRSQDSKDDTSSVASSFLSGLEGTAKDCIDSLPSLNGAAEAAAITNQLNKCCPLIKKTLEDANTLAGKSGLITFLQSEEKKYSIVSKCSSQQAS